MIGTHSRSLPRVALMLAGLSLAIGGVSCGGSDGDGDGGSAQTEDKQQIQTVLDDFRIALDEDDAEAGCALAAKPMRRQLSAFNGAGNCAEGFHELTKLDITAADLKPRIIAYEIKGDRASVVGFASHTQSRQTATLSKEGEEWKLVEWFTARRS